MRHWSWISCQVANKVKVFRDKQNISFAQNETFVVDNDDLTRFITRTMLLEKINKWFHLIWNENGSRGIKLSYLSHYWITWGKLFYFLQEWVMLKWQEKHFNTTFEYQTALLMQYTWLLSNIKDFKSSTSIGWWGLHLKFCELLGKKKSVSTTLRHIFYSSHGSVSYISILLYYSSVVLPYSHLVLGLL